MIRRGAARAVAHIPKRITLAKQPQATSLRSLYCVRSREHSSQAQLVSLSGFGNSQPVRQSHSYSKSQTRPIIDGRGLATETTSIKSAQGGALHVRRTGSDTAATYDVCLGPGTVLNNLWLRDRCQCDDCVHPETKQRLFDTFSIPLNNLQISRCEHDKQTNTLHVTWQDGHQSQYNAHAIEASFDNAAKYSVIQGDTATAYWDEVELKDADFEQVMQSDAGLKQLMRTIREYGYAYVDNCPATPEDTQALLDRIGPIRNTHYGGFYDFTSDLSSKDTAYTSIALDAHTDTTYFSEPARLQLFHLLSHTHGTGGETQLVDSFKAALELQTIDPQAYEVLSQVKLSAHASGNDGISIQPLEPFTTFKHDDISGRLVQVRWNVSDRGTFLADPAAISEWYAAARKFNDILRTENEAWRVETRLRPGKPVIIDNWRVLHGRSAFSGKRRMSGGYISNDDFISCYKMTNLGKEAVVGAQVF